MASKNNYSKNLPTQRIRDSGCSNLHAHNTLGSFDNRLKEGVEPPRLERNTGICTQPPGAVAVFPGGIGVRRSGSSGRSLTQNHAEECKSESTGDYDVELQDNVFFVAELSRPPYLVIEGVKHPNPWPLRIFQILSIIVVSSLVAAAAAMITLRLVPTTPSWGSNIPTSLNNNTARRPYGNVTDTSKDTGDVAEYDGNMDWTITDALTYEIENEGAYSSQGPFFVKSVVPIFFAELNRTDTQFTLFSIAAEAKIFEGLDISTVIKMALPLWNGHSLDARQRVVVEGQAVAVKDMYHGMVLTSVTGYPILINLNPFRMNNATLSVAERDLRYKNGIVHKLVNYPHPAVPWIGKSLYDVLLEANDERNGNLSVFQGLIDKSPDILSQLQLQKGDTKAITLFVPTNAAQLAALEPSLILDDVMRHNFLQSHIVAGNFATRCWLTIPTGTIVSDTELWLESQGGQVLMLNITDKDNVTINGTVTIIGRDIFSEQGIIHIIEKPLMMMM